MMNPLISGEAEHLLFFFFRGGRMLECWLTPVFRLWGVVGRVPPTLLRSHHWRCHVTTEGIGWIWV